MHDIVLAVSRLLAVRGSIYLLPWPPGRPACGARFMRTFYSVSTQSR
jgi:hypothetical protein